MADDVAGRGGTCRADMGTNRRPDWGRCLPKSSFISGTFWDSHSWTWLFSTVKSVSNSFCWIRRSSASVSSCDFKWKICFSALSILSCNLSNSNSYTQYRSKLKILFIKHRLKPSGVEAEDNIVLTSITEDLALEISWKIEVSAEICVDILYYNIEYTRKTYNH